MGYIYVSYVHVVCTSFAVLPMCIGKWNMCTMSAASIASLGRAFAVVDSKMDCNKLRSMHIYDIAYMIYIILIKLQMYIPMREMSRYCGERFHKSHISFTDGATTYLFKAIQIKWTTSAAFFWDKSKYRICFRIWKNILICSGIYEPCGVTS